MFRTTSNEKREREPLLRRSTMASAFDPQDPSGHQGRSMPPVSPFGYPNYGTMTQTTTDESLEDKGSATRIPVGFDRVAVAKRPTDSLVTSGLANCIAIAVQDHHTGMAAMGHYDTRNCFDAQCKIVPQNLAAFKTLLLNELAQVTGGTPAPQFHIALGEVWKPADASIVLEDSTLEMFSSLLITCQDVFGTGPTAHGETAEFFLGAGEIKGNHSGSAPGKPEILPSDDPNARNAGDDIPYARLAQPNAHGHKLDKNLTWVDKASIYLKS